MALSMDEQRMLAEIERRLAAEDPGLAAKLSSFRRPGPAVKFRSTRSRIIGSLFTVALLAVVSLMIYAMVPFRAHSPKTTTFTPPTSTSATAPAGTPAGTAASAAPGTSAPVRTTQARSTAPKTTTASKTTTAKKSSARTAAASSLSGVRGSSPASQQSS